MIDQQQSNPPLSHTLVYFMNDADSDHTGLWWFFVYYLRVPVWQKRAQQGILGSRRRLSVSVGGPRQQRRTVESPSVTRTHRHTSLVASMHLVSPAVGRHEGRGVSWMTLHSSPSLLIKFPRSTNWICEWVWHDLIAACIITPKAEDPNIVIWIAACTGRDTRRCQQQWNPSKSVLTVSLDFSSAPNVMEALLSVLSTVFFQRPPESPIIYTLNSSFFLIALHLHSF